MSAAPVQEVEATWEQKRQRKGRGQDGSRGHANVSDIKKLGNLEGGGQDEEEWEEEGERSRMRSECQPRETGH